MQRPLPCHRVKIVSGFLAGSALAALAFALAADAAAKKEDHTAWNDYLGAADSSHYSALKQIDRSNVGKLEVAWSFPTQDKTAYVFSPIVVDNVMYLLADRGKLVAINATDGKELWSHSLDSDH